MTVIAWDGKTLAADKQNTNFGYASTVTKIFRVPGGAVGFVGNEAHAMELLNWFRSGREPKDWPDGKARENTADAIFVSDKGECFGYASPYGARVEDPFIAYGCGRDYALAALYLGKTAREAVEVACALDVNCGRGIDVLEMK